MGDNYTYVSTFYLNKEEPEFIDMYQEDQNSTPPDETIELFLRSNISWGSKSEPLQTPTVSIDLVTLMPSPNILSVTPESEPYGIRLQWQATPLTTTGFGTGTGPIKSAWPPDYIEFTENTVISFDDNQYDGMGIVINGCTLTVDGEHNFPDLHVINGGTLTHSQGHAEGMKLAVANDIIIDSTSHINVSGKGYSSASGPGAGGIGKWSSGGAGHGGLGGDDGFPTPSEAASGGPSYGSIIEPNSLGSGGGHPWNYSGEGGAGGGIVRLEINGSLILYGAINADGLDGLPRGGGGSGGSIYVITESISGTGTISADGGDWSPDHYYAGGGSGGRVALCYDTSAYNGEITAKGGLGFYNGASGTIYKKAFSQQYGDLIVNNNGTDGAITPLKHSNSYNIIEIDGFAKAEIEDLCVIGTNDLTVNDNSVLILNSTLETNDLTINNLSIITHESISNGFNLLIQNNMIIDASSSIDVSGKGHPSALGPGAGGQGLWSSGGGGYGGYGGADGYPDTQWTTYGGSPYGSITEPFDLGSGGGHPTDWTGTGGAGGGLVRLTVGNILTLNGTINADGLDGIPRGGGGSGGSVYVKTGHFAGSGTISSNGGDWSPDHYYAGGGSGGRIAIYYDSMTFDGNIVAYGGIGSFSAGAGTIYFKKSDEKYGDLMIDNNNIEGGITELNDLCFLNSLDVTNHSNFHIVDSNVITISKINISGNGLLSCNSRFHVGDINIITGGLLTHDVSQKGFGITAWGDLLIDPNSSIDVSGKGYPSASGPGAGGIGRWSSGGAGYGGYGGDDGFPTPSEAASGGEPYGSESEPLDFGSGGGHPWDYDGEGGAGGGVVRLAVGGNMMVNGEIKSNGLEGVPRGGGGSGGSVCIIAKNISGEGKITSDGGDWSPDHYYAGGGSGGRIAINYENMVFDLNNITSRGGIGYNDGNDGTVGLLPSCAENQASPDLVFVDVPEKAYLGHPFSVKISATNNTGWGGMYSAINSSLLYLNGSHNLVVNGPLASSWADLATCSQPNQTNIFDPDGNFIGLNQDHFLEVVDNCWIGGEGNTLQFSVEPNEIGTILIRTRVTLQDRMTGTFLTDCNCSGGELSFDQQGWIVRQYRIDVIEPLQGDFEPDGDVDLADFAILAKAWLAQPDDENWNPECNINDPVDQIIDLKDLSVLADNWLGNSSP